MSDIQEFTQNVLERAKARSKIIKRTLGQEVEDTIVEDVDVDETEDVTMEPEPEPQLQLEEENSDMISDDSSLSSTPPSSTPVRPLKMPHAIPLTPHHVNVQVTSASPGGRVTRLKALAQSINSWDDDYSHHCPPTSRFNLSVPTRKSVTFPSSANRLKLAEANDRVRTLDQPKSSSVVDSNYCLNAIAKDTVPSSSTNNNKGKKVTFLVAEELDISNISNTSSECSVVGGNASCSNEGDISSKHIKLSDSFVFYSPADSEKPQRDLNINISNSDKIQTTNLNDEKREAEKCVFDDSVLNALEAQGYVVSPSKTKLFYDYKNPESGNQKENSPKKYQLPSPVKSTSPVKRAASPVRPTPVCSKTPSPVKSPAKIADNAPRVVDVLCKQFGQQNEEVKQQPTSTAAKLDSQRIRVSVAEKAAMFESGIITKEIDPTELSVAERAKLFEGRGRFQKKPTTASPKSKASSSPTRYEAPKSAVPRRFPRPSMIPEKPLRSKLMLFERGIKEEDSEESDTESLPPPPPPLPKHQQQHQASQKREVSFVLPKSPSRSPTRSPPRGTSSPISPAKRRSLSPKANYPGARDTKRIRVNEPKPGRIYPSLTDMEATETETDTDVERMQEEEDLEDSETSIISGSSLGTYIERKAVENSPTRVETTRPSHRYRPSMTAAPSDDFNASLACRQVDAFIDEALEGQDFSLETVIDESSPVAASSPLKQRTRSPSPTRQNLLNQHLVHTVSFYRLQQSKGTPQQITATPKRQLPPIVDAPESPTPKAERTFSHEDRVNQLIRKLGDDVQAQQRAIAQASKALSLCKSTLEFSDSQENVECERILLISTQKHGAIMNEIHRLKTEGILGRKEILSPTKVDMGPSCQGNMTLLDVAVQLKREFVNIAMKGQKVYHFLALAKYRNQIEASTLVSMGNGISTSNIHGGVLYFPNAFTIGGLEPDFRVSMEVFMLETMREYLPHEAKYHIKKDPKGKQTPKKMKSDSQSKALFRHFQHSPAGPDAVQPCRFKSVGSLSIDISTLQRSHWTLEKVLHTSPLDGNVSIKIQCSAEGGVEERGFLTMFQDVSGFGAWHRRWCKLTPAELCFWMYPEDENVNEPLGTIPLRSCVTSRIGPVPRDVCARANTFLLVTTRLPQGGDRDSLVTSCREKYTAVRHLISADTKEERDLWCKQFNRALANLRAWDPHAHSPDDSLF